MCEHASLCAYDVTEHEQKDLVRISQGLDIYFNVFCQVKCVIRRSNEQSGPNRHAAKQAIFTVLKKLKKLRCYKAPHLTDKSNKLIHDLLMASKNKKVLTFFFSNTAIFL